MHDGIGDPAAEEHRRLVASAEGKSFVQNKVAALIIPHAVQRVVLGGVPILAAVTTLKDARTGAELAKPGRLWCSASQWRR